MGIPVRILTVISDQIPRCVNTEDAGISSSGHINRSERQLGADVGRRLGMDQANTQRQKREECEVAKGCHSRPPACGREGGTRTARTAAPIVLRGSPTVKRQKFAALTAEVCLPLLSTTYHNDPSPPFEE